VVLTAVFLLLRNKKQDFLNKIIKQDCLLFDSTKITADKYFLKERVNCNNVENENEANTSRNLKGEERVVAKRKATADPFVLKDNLERMEQNDDDNAIRNKGPDVHIYNTNFVVRKNTQEITTDDRFGNNGELSSTQSESSKNEITLMDYESLSFNEMLCYDKRTFTGYIGDNLIRHHVLLSIFLKHSIIDPTHIRIAKLVFSLSLIFGLNALLGDSYKQNFTKLGNVYNFGNGILSLIIANIIYNIVILIVYIPASTKIKFSNALKTRDLQTIENAQ
jgi:hypothetical protein